MSSSGRKPLSLKGNSGSSTVRQSLSHSRTKAVVVEKKRRRVVTPKDGAEAKAADSGAAATVTETVVETKAPAAPKPKDSNGAAAQAPAAPKPAPKKKVLRTLTEEEKQKRAAALTQAKKQAVEDEKRRVEDEKRRAEEDARRAVEEEENRKREAEEAERRAKEEAQEAKAQEAQEAKAAAEAKATPAAPAPTPEERAEKTGTRARPAEPVKRAGDDDRAKRGRGTEDPNKNQPKSKTEARRRTGRLTINQALDDDGSERTRSLASVRRARERERRRAQSANQQPQFVVRDVVIPEVITVQELANRMATRAVDVIKVLMKQGMMLKINDVIDADTAQIIAEEHGHTVKRVSEADVEEGLIGKDDDEGDLENRAPVVTIMGHVDHGKTSLLDALRSADVVSGEAGGITQHIGAYQVALESGDKISFLDTPGHAAFTQMRARGAKVTDLVVLVVAADDGVMPQTAEAIAHAKAAEVPIIVAINKIDKPDADPNRVRQDLLQHDLVVEGLGGDIQDVEVSAIQKTGLDKLQEAILLQAEIMELKANPDRAAEGVAIEAKLDKGRGPVATVLIQRGTLKVGDVFVAGAEWGRVRALINDHGDQVDEAGPSVPVEILGFNGTPEAGDIFAVVENEARAREISEYRQRKRREMRVGGTGGRGSLEQMLAQLKATEKKEFPLVIKGDVQGSVEAIVGALDQISTDEVAARPIHSAVGGITESDVILAQASNCPIIAFNVRANSQARDMAHRDGVEIRYYSVIYDLVDDVKAAMSGLLDPTLREHFLGNAEILEVFNISKVGKVAGCRVTEGVVKRGAKVRLIRDQVVIHEGTLSTLKRFKDEVKEVHGGQECGMAFETYQDMQKADVIECFEVEEIQRTL